MRLFRSSMGLITPPAFVATAVSDVVVTGLGVLMFWTTMLAFMGAGMESLSSTTGRPLGGSITAVCGWIGGGSSGEVTEAAFATLAAPNKDAVVITGLGFVTETTVSEGKQAKTRNKEAC